MTESQGERNTVADKQKALAKLELNDMYGKVGTPHVQIQSRRITRALAAKLKANGRWQVRKLVGLWTVIRPNGDVASIHIKQELAFRYAVAYAIHHAVSA